MSKRIGLLSDTHSYLDPDVFKYFEECDEIWHAGDIGSPEVIEQLEAFKETRIVYGNIDDKTVQLMSSRDLHFEIEGVKVWITHIGGYPGRYSRGIPALLDEYKPDLFICGHSHILRVMPDKKRKILHMNPGACGRYGFHQIRTLLRFTIDKGNITEVQVIELGTRS